MTRDPRYLEYFHLFLEEKFFEAHDVLEELWKSLPEEEPRRQFYQGLIQLAASLVHFQKGNPPGALELFQKAARRLKAYPAFYEGVQIPETLAAFQAFHLEWAKHPENPGLAKRFLPRVTLKV